MIKQCILTMIEKLTIKGLIVFLILINLSLISCYKNEFEKKITDSNSFWYIYEYDSTNNSFKNINYGYKFQNNGRYKYMNYDYSYNKLSEFKDVMNDVRSSNKWSYNRNNNLFILNYWNQKVIYNSKDTIVLEHIDTSKKYILINLGDKNPEVLKFVKCSY